MSSTRKPLFGKSVDNATYPSRESSQVSSGNNRKKNKKGNSSSSQKTDNTNPFPFDNTVVSPDTNMADETKFPIEQTNPIEEEDENSEAVLDSGSLRQQEQEQIEAVAKVAQLNLEDTLPLPPGQSVLDALSEIPEEDPDKYYSSDKSDTKSEIGARKRRGPSPSERKEMASPDQIAARSIASPKPSSLFGSSSSPIPKNVEILHLPSDRSRGPQTQSHLDSHQSAGTDQYIPRSSAFGSATVGPFSPANMNSKMIESLAYDVGKVYLRNMNIVGTFPNSVFSDMRKSMNKSYQDKLGKALDELAAELADDLESKIEDEMEKIASKFSEHLKILEQKVDLAVETIKRTAPDLVGVVEDIKNVQTSLRSQLNSSLISSEKGKTDDVLEEINRISDKVGAVSDELEEIPTNLRQAEGAPTKQSIETIKGQAVLFLDAGDDY